MVNCDQLSLPEPSALRHDGRNLPKLVEVGGYPVSRANILSGCQGQIELLTAGFGESSYDVIYGEDYSSNVLPGSV